MGIHKITNITNTLNKRHPNYNKTLNVDFNVGFTKQSKKLQPGSFIFMEGGLPLSIEKLRLDGLVLIEEKTKEGKAQKEFLQKNTKTTEKKKNSSSDIQKKTTTKKTPKKGRPKKTTTPSPDEWDEKKII